MPYEIYKQILDKETYFNSWDDENTKRINNSLKDQVYQRYVLRCQVYNRDGFRCKNTSCKHPGSELTMHHIKWQKNGGMDKIRNCVTLCRNCHEGFNRAEIELKFGKDECLPPHIKGHTFKLQKPAKEELEWKQLKSDMRKFRKSVKDCHGVRLTFAQLELLLKWLEVVYDQSKTR